MAERIQLKRVKDWRLPEGALSVARGSKWGNPFSIAGAIENAFAGTEAEARKVAVEFYRRWITFADPADGDVYTTSSKGGRYDRRWVRDHLGELRGRTLACWCKPGESCHADVLLELANRADRTTQPNGEVA